jgi:hypothetical protein
MQMELRTALFWVITQGVVVISYPEERSSRLLRAKTWNHTYGADSRGIHFCSATVFTFHLFRSHAGVDV